MTIAAASPGEAARPKPRSIPPNVKSVATMTTPATRIAPRRPAVSMMIGAMRVQKILMTLGGSVMAFDVFDVY